METEELIENLQSKAVVSFKHILLATDFSDVSQTALAYASATAKVHGSKLSVVHVLTPEPRSFIPMDPLPVAGQDERERAEQSMREYIASISLEGVEHEEVLVTGAIWTALDSFIHERGIDLLVLGTHGREGLRKLILGSIAEELFRLARCPVLTVGPGVNARGANRPLKTVLFATDFKPASLNALPYAISITREHNARLILLHLLPIRVGVGIGPYWTPDAAAADVEDSVRLEGLERLRRLIPADLNLAHAPELKVTYDFLPDGILKYDADMIVMGVNHTASPRAAAHLPWVAAHEVIGNARCPVLTVSD